MYSCEANFADILTFDVLCSAYKSHDSNYAGQSTWNSESVNLS